MPRDRMRISIHYLRPFRKVNQTAGISCLDRAQVDIQSGSRPWIAFTETVRQKENEVRFFMTPMPRPAAWSTFDYSDAWLAIAQYTLWFETRSHALAQILWFFKDGHIAAFGYLSDQVEPDSEAVV